MNAENILEIVKKQLEYIKNIPIPEITGIKEWREGTIYIASHMLYLINELEK